MYIYIYYIILHIYIYINPRPSFGTEKCVPLYFCSIQLFLLVSWVPKNVLEILVCQRKSSIGIVIWYKDEKMYAMQIYSKHVCCPRICPRTSKVYGCFHVFSWGCMIDRCFCPRSAAVSWMSSASMHGVHDWFMHDHQNVMRCNDGLCGSIHVIWSKAKLSKKC